MANLYNELMRNENKKQIYEYEMEIKKLEEKIRELENGIEDYSSRESSVITSVRLLDTQDRIQIIDEMKRDLSDENFSEYTRSLKSLFTHVNNINYVYKKENLKCPQWYSDKYGHLF